jgi:hypothetical protein
VAIIYRCNQQIGCSFELWGKTVTLGQWLDHCSAIAADPEWPCGQRHFVDLQSTSDISTIYESDVDEVADLFSIFSERIKDLRIALLVAPGNRTKGELFAKFISRLEVTAYVTEALEEACQWLALNCDEAKSVFSELKQKFVDYQ